jgi:hypothetical protein
MAHKAGLAGVPDSVAELGPGHSLGIGLAALTCGVNKYYAVDLVALADKSLNATVFDDLVRLFQAREEIPGPAEYPKVKPR